jgi:hypothetical protein
MPTSVNTNPVSSAMKNAFLLEGEWLVGTTNPLPNFFHVCSYEHVSSLLFTRKTGLVFVTSQSSDSPETLKAPSVFHTCFDKLG